VSKTLEIIAYYQPRFWFLENPASGLLPNRQVVAGEPFVDVDYCMYGADYRKRTRLWGKHPGSWAPKELCKFNCKSCLASQTGRHLSTAQRGSGWSLNELHHIPPELMLDIVEAVEFDF
jgi:hypothetical protein